MRISTQQYSVALLSVAVMLSTAVMLFVNSRQIAAATDKINLAREIVMGLTELRLVTVDYILYHNVRAKTQWRERHASLEQLLLSDVFDQKPAERSIISRVRKHDRSMRSIFSKLVENYETEKGSPEELLLLQQAEARWASQLLQTSQTSISEGFNLQRLNDVELAEAQRRQNVWIFILMILVAVKITANLTLTLRYVLGPISRMQKGMATISQGNLDFRMGTDSANEIGDLSRAFDRMTERLKESRNSIEHNAAQLMVANKELEAFSYSVSHDLRAPLRGIDGFSQVLLEDYADKLDDQGKDYLNRVRKASQRMSTLINDLLNLSRVTRAPMHRVMVNLSERAAEIAGDLRQQHPDRKTQLVIQDNLNAEGDPPLLQVLLTNLLSNAWKFTGRQAQARIEFGMQADKAQRVFFVRDNGVGFDMAYADKLFGAFQRLHSETDFPGTGIGLATVQRIVHRHGGVVWAEGEPGKGASFYFTLDGNHPSAARQNPA